MQEEATDYLVVGSGLAGLTFALHAAQHGRVLILTKSDLAESNTSYAQGGIAAAIGESDSWELHEEDTLAAGDGLCNAAAVRFLVQNAPEAIRWLSALGAQFDSSRLGLQLGLEGGHSRSRIVKHRDTTGQEIERAVSTAVRSHPRIRVVENCFVTSVVTSNGRCVGVTSIHAELGPRVHLARGVMLATGGCGRMYEHTTNPRIATGDGLALALRAGARLQNMEFMQFHPTTLYHPQLRSFLISEAVRGAGGILRNHEGTRFLYDYDLRLELAPRDVLSRAIDAEMKRLGTWCVYLDVTHLARDEIEEEFPSIVASLRTVGIEPHKHRIPVVPAQHYSCGGVATDLHARSTLPGLYAAGEVACTGVHGANRLASNSLLEAIVFAAAAAEAIRDEPIGATEPIHPQPVTSISESDAVRLRRRMQRTMSEHVGIVRTELGLDAAIAAIEVLQAEYESLPQVAGSVYSLETRNLLDAALEVARAARARRQNAGVHYNADLASESFQHI